MIHNYSTISVQMDERGVVSLRLDRAEKKNALSALMIEELTHFASNLPSDARVVVLSGAGDVFCAGGDLGWMKAQIDADRATRMQEARKLALMLNALNELDAPLIGRVHGGAFGGGIGMCCVCDCVIAEQGTKFGLTETRLGLAEVTPYLSVAPHAVAASKRLARSLGPKITPDIIDMTIQALADTWEGEEAEHGISAFLGKTKPRWMP
jgi:methylglutaconyl-CoA hydratase